MRYPVSSSARRARSDGFPAVLGVRVPPKDLRGGIGRRAARISFLVDPIRGEGDETARGREETGERGDSPSEPLGIVVSVTFPRRSWDEEGSPLAQYDPPLSRGG
jgi:hypothetical protein